MPQVVSRSMTRRSFTVGAALALTAAAGAARAADQFHYRFAHSMPVGHPLDLRTKDLWAAVDVETKGRLKVDVFPNNTLGNDTSALAEVRSGAVDFVCSSDAVLSTIAPLTGIMNVGFAFKTSDDAHAALNGPLGDMVRSAIASAGVVVLPKVFDTGMRQVTTSRKPVLNAADLTGLKLRVPPAKIFVDLFQTLGASPVAINLSDLYTALQTHVVDGTELPLATIDAQHVNEVQSTISLTNHAWSGFFMLANPGSWKALPPDIQDVVRRNVEKYSALEIADVATLSKASLGKLQSKGMTVNQVDTQSFRGKLGPYYTRWKATFGAPAWEALERISGPLG